MDSIFTCLDTALELELRALPYPSAVVAHRVGRAEASLARMREAYQNKLRDIMQQLSATPLETVAEEPSSAEMECFESPPTFLTPSSTPTRKRKRRCSRVIAPMRITTEFIPPPSSEAARAERAARRQW